MNKKLYRSLLYILAAILLAGLVAWFIKWRNNSQLKKSLVKAT